MKNTKMSSAAQHADPTASDVGGVHPSDSAPPDQVQLLHRLQMLKLQVDLDAQNIAQLREQNKALEDALAAERALVEKHAEAFMRIARTCDDRCSELKDQHAAALGVKDILIAKLEDAAAAKDVIIAEVRAEHGALNALRAENAALRAEVSVLQSRTTSNLTDIHAAIAALHTLEIHPVRRDRRQFAAWHAGSIPALPEDPPIVVQPIMTFDHGWCAAACGEKWSVDIDAATSTRAQVTQMGPDSLTLRSAAPLLRRALSAAHVHDVGEPHHKQQHQPQEGLPAYRIIAEAYGHSVGPYRIGFIPNHEVGADGAAGAMPITVTPGQGIQHYGGWSITVFGQRPGYVEPDAAHSGWLVLTPRGTALRRNGRQSRQIYSRALGAHGGKFGFRVVPGCDGPLQRPRLALCRCLSTLVAVGFECSILCFYLVTGAIGFGARIVDK
jgi:hypothetical protein